MTETARALNAEEVIELIRNHIAACLDGGPNRKAEDIELGRSAGLKVEMISDLWDDAEKQLQASIELQVLRPTTQAETSAEEPKTLTALKSADEPLLKEEIGPSASKPKRRSLAPDPSEEAAKAEAQLFISPSIQPSVEEQPKPEEAKPEEAISLSKLLTSMGAQKREELFKAIVADKALTATQPLAFQHSKSPTGIPASLENAITAISKLDIDCRYDVFHDRIIVKGHECGVNGDALENLENVTLKVRQAVLTRFGFDPSATFTFDALKLRCLDRVFDPVRDYLDTLKWDGEARLDDWLVHYCGAEDTELNRAIGRKMLIAAVRRVRSPGCKFDYIVVLEGEQGVGKSSLLRLLAGEENFTDNEIIGLDKREQQEAIQGIWIYEVAELDGLHKSDVTKVKLFASKTVDSARPAYARSRVDRPRRGIFVATTNEDTYLRDTTGNRRFWPVRLHGVIPSLDGKMMIDLVGIKRDRDQLWAEASVVEATGEPLVIPEALWLDVAQQQQVRMELDPWMDALACRLVALRGKIEGSYCQAADNDGNPEWRVSTDWLITDVLGLPKQRQFHNHTKRLASIMRELGWQRPETVIRIGKEVKRGFTKPVEAS